MEAQNNIVEWNNHLRLDQFEAFIADSNLQHSPDNLYPDSGIKRTFENTQEFSVTSAVYKDDSMDSISSGRAETVQSHDASHYNVAPDQSGVAYQNQSGPIFNIEPDQSCNADQFTSSDEIDVDQSNQPGGVHDLFPDQIETVSCMVSAGEDEHSTQDTGEPSAVNQDILKQVMEEVGINHGQVMTNEPNNLDPFEFIEKVLPMGSCFPNRDLTSSPGQISETIDTQETNGKGIPEFEPIESSNISTTPTVSPVMSVYTSEVTKQSPGTSLLRSSPMQPADTQRLVSEVGVNNPNVSQDAFVQHPEEQPIPKSEAPVNESGLNDNDLSWHIPAMSKDPSAFHPILPLSVLKIPLNSDELLELKLMSQEVLANTNMQVSLDLTNKTTDKSKVTTATVTSSDQTDEKSNSKPVPTPYRPYQKRNKVPDMSLAHEPVQKYLGSTDGGLFCCTYPGCTRGKKPGEHYTSFRKYLVVRHIKEVHKVGAQFVNCKHCKKILVKGSNSTGHERKCGKSKNLEARDQK